MKAPDPYAVPLVSRAVDVVGHAVEYRGELMRADDDAAAGPAGIMGTSAALARVLCAVERVAPTDMTVLILGGTGTGKELVARAVHEQSTRRSRPLIKVNCAALPGDLIESELFGHEKGAFTGAAARQIGRFELAHGATIFLGRDRRLTVGAAGKAIAGLAGGELQRLGSGKTIRVDTRVMAATNRDLRAAVAKGRFRADLYYRLNVYPIALPPLRERPGDIPLLARKFLAEAQQRLGRAFEPIPTGVCDTLQAYDWPGNIRELQNVIQRAALTSPTARLELPEGWRTWAPGAPASRAEALLPSAPPSSNASISDVAAKHIIHILERTRWRIEGPGGAANILGLNL